mmetsp:Transcript_16158/g.56387  ORF Transcript_16158/g.56387 Transcript_16158/m.56387 type:complete len:318 (+) Transcript_16158:4254-5207(+)
MGCQHVASRVAARVRRPAGDHSGAARRDAGRQRLLWLRARHRPRRALRRVRPGSAAHARQRERRAAAGLRDARRRIRLRRDCAVRRGAVGAGPRRRRRLARRDLVQRAHGRGSAGEGGVRRRRRGWQEGGGTRGVTDAAATGQRGAPHREADARAASTHGRPPPAGAVAVGALRRQAPHREVAGLPGGVVVQPAVRVLHPAVRHQDDGGRAVELGRHHRARLRGQHLRVEPDIGDAQGGAQGGGALHAQHAPRGHGDVPLPPGRVDAARVAERPHRCWQEQGQWRQQRQRRQRRHHVSARGGDLEAAPRLAAKQRTA